MKILGVSAFYHDSAAALLDDGEIVAAAQEERFTRKKFDPAFPINSIEYCLTEAGCRLRDVDYVAFHDKPHGKFKRLVATYAAYAPKGFQSFRRAMPLWLGSKLFQKAELLRRLRAMDGQADFAKRLLFAEHHQSHAASAFYPSPFDRALVLTLDGVGEWATTSVAIGSGGTLTPEREIRFPHSLGLLYSAVTQYLGFKVLSGEYKVMGLAPYGDPTLKSLFLEHLIDVRPDGSFRLDQSYFDYCAGQRMFSDRFVDLFGQPPRHSEDDPLTPFHMNMAASLQAVTEDVVVALCRSLVQEHGVRDLCLAGGVALNCVANGRLIREGVVDRLWVQPAAGDAGCALGAALAAWSQHLGQPRKTPADGDGMSGAYLGISFTQSDIEARLSKAGAVFDVCDEEGLISETATALAEGKAVGWFQGRMEYGPRALGARSILADPRSEEMQRTLNLKVKFRESFRPFAPSVLQEDAADWFELDAPSPYMLVTAGVRSERRLSVDDTPAAGFDRINQVRSDIPAVTHVDYSARIQTVDGVANPRYHRLLSAFKATTGCPVLVNTSFNVRGEPIVCTPEDAFRCFMGTGLDLLAIGNCILEKKRQNPALATNYRSEIDPD